jgi:hypothetical protein
MFCLRTATPGPGAVLKQNIGRGEFAVGEDQVGH